MNSLPLQIAIIGCGRIAGHHCRAIRETKDLKLAAVCDLEISKAKAYSDEYDIPCYQNYHEMMKTHPNIDIVAVITPSGMHFEHAHEIQTLYKKHLIIEKPTFLKPEHYEKILAGAHKNNLRVFPVFQNRYNLAVQRVKKGLTNGELGEIRHVAVRVRWCRPQRYYDMSPWRGTFAMDGGALTNQGVHHVDLLRYLGGEIEKVCSTMGTFGANIEVEDTIAAAMKFKSGKTGTLEVTTSARPHDYEASLSFVCENGLAQLGGIAVNELQTYTPEPAACAQHSEDFSGCVYGNGHYAFYRDLAENMKSEAPFPTSNEDALNSLQLLQAFYVSHETGNWVAPESKLQSKHLGKADEKLANLYRTSKPSDIK